MIKARIKFNKAGSMKFIGHLDVMRYFQKAIRRSGVDVAYSQGFSPHQLLSFASPLGVGLTSDGEYMDIQLNSIVSSEDVKNRLNQAMSEEMQVLSVKVLPEGSKTAMSLLAAADYMVSIKDGYEICPDFPGKLQEFLGRESLFITKKTKKSQMELDLKPYIYAVSFSKEEFQEKTGQAYPASVAETYENGCVAYMQLACGSVANIKPELVLEAFCQAGQIPYNPFACQIHRLELYTDVHAKKGQIHSNESGELRKLAPLDAFGELAP